jgi:hypothetical protein
MGVFTDLSLDVLLNEVLPSLHDARDWLSVVSCCKHARRLRERPGFWHAMYATADKPSFFPKRVAPQVPADLVKKCCLNLCKHHPLPAERLIHAAKSLLPVGLTIYTDSNHWCEGRFVDIHRIFVPSTKGKICQLVFMFELDEFPLAKRLTAANMARLLEKRGWDTEQLRVVCDNDVPAVHRSFLNALLSRSFDAMQDLAFADAESRLALMTCASQLAEAMPGTPSAMFEWTPRTEPPGSKKRPDPHRTCDTTHAKRRATRKDSNFRLHVQSN